MAFNCSACLILRRLQMWRFQVVCRRVLNVPYVPTSYSLLSTNVLRLQVQLMGPEWAGRSWHKNMLPLSKDPRTSEMTRTQPLRRSWASYAVKQTTPRAAPLSHRLEIPILFSQLLSSDHCAPVPSLSPRPLLICLPLSLRSSKRPCWHQEQLSVWLACVSGELWKQCCSDPTWGPLKQDMAARKWLQSNPNTQESEAGELQQVQVQPDQHNSSQLHNEFLSQNTYNKGWWHKSIMPALGRQKQKN